MDLKGDESVKHAPSRSCRCEEWRENGGKHLLCTEKMNVTAIRYRICCECTENGGKSILCCISVVYILCINVLFMVFDPFSSSDRWCTSIFLRCPECLQVINFLSCFLRCNQRCSAFLEVYFCTAVHLHDGNARPLLTACPFLRNHSEHSRTTQWIFRETRDLDYCLWRSKALRSFFPA